MKCLESQSFPSYFWKVHSTHRERERTILTAKCLYITFALLATYCLLDRSYTITLLWFLFFFYAHKKQGVVEWVDMLTSFLPLITLSDPLQRSLLVFCCLMMTCKTQWRCHLVKFFFVLSFKSTHKKIFSNSQLWAILSPNMIYISVSYLQHLIH